MPEQNEIPKTVDRIKTVDKGGITLDLDTPKKQNGFLKFVKGLFTHNLALKGLAVFSAVVLWLIAIAV